MKENKYQYVVRAFWASEVPRLSLWRQKVSGEGPGYTSQWWIYDKDNHSWLEGYYPNDILTDTHYKVIEEEDVLLIILTHSFFDFKLRSPTIFDLNLFNHGK
jgi:hypothetical protein